MFLHLRVTIRHELIKRWAVKYPNCHFYEINLFLTNLSIIIKLKKKMPLLQE